VDRVASAAETGIASAIEALDRQERSRAIGVPTVSVLVGPTGLAARAARRWAETSSRPLVSVHSTRLDEVASVWIERLCRERDLVRDAAGWLSARLERDSEAVWRSLERKTPFEREAFLDATLPPTSRTGAEAACRWLLHRSAAGEVLDAAGLMNALDAALGDFDGRWTRVVVALRALVPAGRDPALMLAWRQTADGSASWVEAAARLLADLVLTDPGLSVILAVTPEAFETFERLAPESRTKALIRQGVISIPNRDADALIRILEETVPGSAPALTGSARRLVSDGASEELVGLFVEAVRATGGVVPGEGQEGRARSAVEQFLYERLETLPETMGLFRLNAGLGFRFGPTRDMEADFSAESLRLVVEIDGYYHFRDAEAFRRDRRKDFELQKRGYLVLRVLADDVVRRLEEVLELILGAVAFRRAGGQRGQGQFA
jgi:very-short-patch-repair endonuclease